MDVSGAGCPAPPDHPHRVSPLTLAAIWLLGGGAVLAAAVLGVRRWAADRAEAVQQRAREMRAEHAVHAAESDMAQVIWHRSIQMLVGCPLQLTCDFKAGSAHGVAHPTCMCNTAATVCSALAILLSRTP